MADADSYTASLVEVVLLNFPAIEAARACGVLQINPISEKSSEGRIAAEKMAALAPKGNRKRGTHYKIEDLCCLVLDIEKAMEVALSPKARARLMARYSYGYQDAEIAEMEGVSDEAVRRMNERSRDAIAAWLEFPKSPHAQSPYYFEPHTHTRKYSAPDWYVPPQR